jgi:hypothetical protein
MLEKIIELYPDEEILSADGFNDAIIGIDVNSFRLIYSIHKCIEILEADGMEFEEAQEYLYFNTIGAYVGERTPIWCDDLRQFD